MAGAALNQCEVCQAFDETPRPGIASTSTVSAFDEEIQVNFLFSGDSVAFRATVLYSKSSLSERFSSKRPLKVRDALAGSWITVFG